MVLSVWTLETYCTGSYNCRTFQKIGTDIICWSWLSFSEWHYAATIPFENPFYEVILIRNTVDVPIISIILLNLRIQTKFYQHFINFCCINQRFLKYAAKIFTRQSLLHAVIRNMIQFKTKIKVTVLIASDFLMCARLHIMRTGFRCFLMLYL